MARPASNLRVFVRFREDTVFAGEDIECTITFKNIDVSREFARSVKATREENGWTRAVDPLEQLRAARGPAQTPSSRNVSATSQSQSKAGQKWHPQHRQTSSLSVVESAERQPPGDGQTGTQPVAQPGPRRKHGRAVSIVSLGGASGQQRPPLRHGRSASVQVSPNALAPASGRLTIAGQRPRAQIKSHSASPLSTGSLSESSTTPPMRASHPRAATIDTSGRIYTDAKGRSRMNASPIPSPRSASAVQRSFMFPEPSTQQSQNSQLTSRPLVDSPVSPGSAVPPPSRSPKLQQGEDGKAISRDQTSPLSHVFSVRSMEGTPRSSADFYSMSNHSNETLASEPPTQANSRLLGSSLLGRDSTQIDRLTNESITEILMMGYVQLSGAFTLDGSLVNQAPFEEVKRKAVVGGQGGGGVVGIKRSAGPGGLFSGLGWGSIGESIGGLMGGSQPSSIKEMKGIADSNSIPLLSTSKSILFVDLRLAPGESKKFTYKFTLPRGLPPSHKGRAIKVTYNLVIGVQRPGSKGSQEQRVKQVEIPFRVFNGVNAHGEALGHDLMSPYIILKDLARTSTIESGSTTPNPGVGSQNASEKPSSSGPDFEAYVNHLLTHPRQDSGAGLLSPTGEIESLQPPRPVFSVSSPTPPPVSARTLIDQTIRNYNNLSSPMRSPTSFTIARASVPIATLTISRPALKLGDLLTCVIDFSSAKLPCYALEATLESSETVDPALAIRSAQSVERVSRRVWARSTENVLWARRCVFRAQVPVASTPGFTTTGVALEWYIRLELVVARQRQEPEADEEDEDDEDGDSDEPTPTPSSTWTAPTKAEQLLEMVALDDRGAQLAARQRLPCDSFEVTIPIRVFGAVVGNTDAGGEVGGRAV